MHSAHHNTEAKHSRYTQPLQHIYHSTVALIKQSNTQPGTDNLIHRKTDRQTKRERERQTETERERERERERETDRETEREINRQTKAPRTNI